MTKYTSFKTMIKTRLYTDDSTIVLPFKFTDHMVVALCPYDGIPGIFKRQTHFPGR